MSLSNVPNRWSSNNNLPRCKKIILIDPWGIQPRPDSEDDRELTWKQSLIHTASATFNPFSVIRAAGPLGKAMLGKWRWDLVDKFKEEDNPEMFLDYIHLCNTLSSAPGEDAFQLLKIPFAWPKHPLIYRLPELDANFPISVLFGQHSWMQDFNADDLELLQTRPIDRYYIRDAGHHVHIDNHQDFNLRMAQIATKLKRNGMFQA